MKTTLFLAALACSMLSFGLLGTNWSADSGHSYLGFSVNHLGISDFHGRFEKFEAKCSTEKGDFTDAVIELSADINSINTGNDKRDAHLQAEDFFDAAKYPTLNFKSTSVKKGKGKDLTIVGDLTMHGVTKSVTLTATYNGTIQHPQSKGDMAGFKVKGKIKRSEFGIAAGMPAPILSDEVNLVADVEFAKN